VINGWFAQSLGSTPIAGYLFLVVGVASDICALILPCAAMQMRPRMAVVAWALWLLTLAWALIASCGFVSVNVAEAQSNRSSPAVDLARRIADTATISRQAECIKRGVLCREREADERKALADLAQARADVVVDPQTTNTSKLIAWLTPWSPRADDVALARLALLTVLPQIGGLVLMVARR
jgi:hypothetical protein